MDNREFKVNINSIVDLKKEYNTHCTNVVNILTDIINEFNNMDEILYTKTSIEYKDRVLKYLNKLVDDIDKRKVDLVRKSDDIASMYQSLFNEVKESVGNNDQMEV